MLHLKEQIFLSFSFHPLSCSFILSSFKYSFYLLHSHHILLTFSNILILLFHIPFVYTICFTHSFTSNTTIDAFHAFTLLCSWKEIHFSFCLSFFQINSFSNLLLFPLTFVSFFPLHSKNIDIASLLGCALKE